MTLTDNIIPIARRYAGVVLISINDEFILQRRDNKTGIVNPGLITPFGGSCKANESTIDCAIREMEEELNCSLLSEKLSILTYFLKEEKDGSYTYMHFYVYDDKFDVKNLQINEGEKIELVPIRSNVDDKNYFSTVCKRVMKEFNDKSQ